MFRPGTWSHDRLQWVVEWMLPTRPEHSPTPARRLWLIMVYVVRRWYSMDHCTSLASSLALQTLLSVVPTAGVLMFIISLTGENAQYGLIEPIARALSPDASRAEAMAQWIVELGRHVNFAELGGIGFIGVTILAYLLFSTLERTVNGIWRMTKSRNMVAKFTMFFTMAVLTPVIVVYSLAEPVIDSIVDWPVVPVLTTSAGLVALNGLLPNQRVKLRAAIAGGLISAALFELGKFGFGWYLKSYAVTTYEGLYGSLAVLPLFVVWSYVSWLIVLLGVEVAWVVHNVHSVAREGYVHPANRSRDRLHGAPGRAAARLLLTIGDNYSRRHTGTTIDALNERFELGLATIVALTDRLIDAGLITTLEKGGYIPARPLDQVKLQDVLGLFEGGEVPTPRADALGSIYGRLDRLQEAEVGLLDFHELVALEAERVASPVAKPLAARRERDAAPGESRGRPADPTAFTAASSPPRPPTDEPVAPAPPPAVDGIVQLHHPKKT